MKKRIIVELIPTSVDPEKGEIIQLSAVKLHDLILIDRFDYRLNEEKIEFKKLITLIDYDKDNFIYKNSTKEILEDFVKWTDNYELLIIDNQYTNNYLSNLKNKKNSILKLFNLEYSDNVIEEIIKKYSLEESNYIVDLLYEALIYESNNRG